mgnify:CR=1 FL=1
MMNVVECRQQLIRKYIGKAQNINSIALKMKCEMKMNEVEHICNTESCIHDVIAFIQAIE